MLLEALDHRVQRVEVDHPILHLFCESQRDRERARAYGAEHAQVSLPLGMILLLRVEVYLLQLCARTEATVLAAASGAVIAVVPSTTAPLYGCGMRVVDSRRSSRGVMLKGMPNPSTLPAESALIPEFPCEAQSWTAFGRYTASRKGAPDRKARTEQNAAAGKGSGHQRRKSTLMGNSTQ